LSSIHKEMSNYGLDWRRMPLGRLSRLQIQEGYKILSQFEQIFKEIETIQNLRGKKYRQRVKDVEKLEGKFAGLTNAFYSLIPHDFGRGLPPEINDREALKEKVRMLDSMRDIESATNLLMERDPNQNELDLWYANIGADISEISRINPTFSLVQRYMNIDGQAGQAGQTELVSLFKVSRWEESSRFANFANNENNMLLWHGSRITNFLGLLSQGLRIAPPEAPSTGYNFGKGVYFADAFAKSLPYCRGAHSTGVHLLLLCEVAVGKSYKVQQPEYMEQPPPGFESTQALGIRSPNPRKTFVTSKGVKVPLGEMIEDEQKSMAYNEFIVYDEARVKIKYVAMVRHQ